MIVTARGRSISLVLFSGWRQRCLMKTVDWKWAQRLCTSHAYGTVILSKRQSEKQNQNKTNKQTQIQSEIKPFPVLITSYAVLGEVLSTCRWNVRHAAGTSCSNSEFSCKLSRSTVEEHERFSLSRSFMQDTSPILNFHANSTEALSKNTNVLACLNPSCKIRLQLWIFMQTQQKHCRWTRTF